MEHTKLSPQPLIWKLNSFPFLKFFKRKWMIKAKQRQLLRDVLLKFIAKEERHQKSRYQRQLDLMQSYILKWRK